MSCLVRTRCVQTDGKPGQGSVHPFGCSPARYFQPGSRQVTVPARRLSVVDGKATLQPETVQALNTPAR